MFIFYEIKLYLIFCLFNLNAFEKLDDKSIFLIREENENINKIWEQIYIFLFHIIVRFKYNFIIYILKIYIYIIYD